MGENSSIQWTHHTFSPWVGCQRVSPGCVHCYAETYDKRVGGVPKKQRADPNVPETRWGPNGRRTRTSVSNWRQPLKWDAAAKAAGVRHRVFCSSLADVFEDRPELEAWRLELFELIRTTTHLDWLLLTKRPENVKRLISYGIDSTVTTPWNTRAVGDWLQAWMNGEPPPNVWLGTTVEDQQRANERIPALLSVPARVRFLSCEPLLGPVQLDVLTVGAGQSLNGLTGERDQAGFGGPGRRWQALPRGVDWVIIGGESGGGARPFELEWARRLVKQCRAAGVAPFVKQLGARPVFGAGDLPDSMWQAYDTNGLDHEEIAAAAREGRVRFLDSAGGDPTEWPEDLRVREFPSEP